MLLLNNMNYPLNPYGSYFSSTGLGSGSLLGINLGVDSVVGEPDTQLYSAGKGFNQPEIDLVGDYMKFAKRDGYSPAGIFDQLDMEAGSVPGTYVKRLNKLSTSAFDAVDNLIVMRIDTKEQLNEIFFGSREVPSEEDLSLLKRKELQSYEHISKALETGSPENLTRSDRGIAFKKITEKMQGDSPEAAALSEKFGDFLEIHPEDAFKVKFSSYQASTKLPLVESDSDAYKAQLSKTQNALLEFSQEEQKFWNRIPNNRSLSSQGDTFSSLTSPLGYGSSSFNSPYLYNSLGTSSLLNNSFNSNSSLSAWTNVQDAWANQLASTSHLSPEAFS